MKSNQPRGYIIYRGPSLLDGQPIVAITLTVSANRKTGDMVQTYILVDNGLRAVANLKSGADASICGDCKFRPALGGACYVVVGHGPTAVTKAYQAGKYPQAIDLESLGSGRMVRLGTYGDPAAVPSDIWIRLVGRSKGHTGYTHQWRNHALGQQHLAALRGLVMASADTPAERDLAQAMGWRTFTVRLASDALAPRESVCPASAEAGKKLQCATCGACNGAASGRKGSIAIIVHGGKPKRYEDIRMATPIL